MPIQLNKQKSVSLDCEKYQADLRSMFLKRYNANRDGWTNEPASIEMANRFQTHLGKDQKYHILDLGAGKGRDVDYFLAHKHKVTGVDLVRFPDWKIISDKYRDSVRWLETSVFDVKSNNTFNALFDNGCFHHQHPSLFETYLAHVKTILQPNSPCLFSVFTPTSEDEDGFFVSMDDGRLCRYFSKNEIQSLFDKSGFRWINAERVFRDTLGLYYLAILVETPTVKL